MAFLGRVGNLLKQLGSKHASIGLSPSNSPLLQAIRTMSSAKLFVGGLSYGTDEMGLREAFQQYGEVIDAKIVTDRDSGRSRGFGFVSYTSTDDANTALQDMDGKELHGRRIRVNFAQERRRPAFGDGVYGYGGGAGGGYGGAGGGGGGYGGAGGGGGYVGAGGYSGGSYGGAGGSGGSYGGEGGYSGGGYVGAGGYSAASQGNSGNHNAGGGNDLFTGGPGGGSGAQAASPGGDEGGVGGDLNHDLAENEGVDDIEDNDDYANTSNK